MLSIFTRTIGYYAHGVDENLNNVNIQKLNEQREELYEGVVTFMFDASYDRVVMQYDGTKLVVWSPLVDNVTVIDNDYSVNDAIFLNGNTVRYVDETGVYDLDVETEERVLLTNNVQPDHAEAYISPDGCWMALNDVIGTYGSRHRVYLFNLCESQQ